jgi:hypothetical protein
MNLLNRITGRTVSDLAPPKRLREGAAQQTMTVALQLGQLKIIDKTPIVISP